MTEKSGKVIWLYPYSAAECWLKGVLVWGVALLLGCRVFRLGVGRDRGFR